MGKLSTHPHRLGISLLVGVLLTAGCSSQRYDRNYWHENFKSSLRSKIGKNFDQPGSGWENAQNARSKTILPNGNVEYMYKMAPSKAPAVEVPCEYSFEVNTETRIVVDAKWKGGYCFLVP
jgi:hypothetical protein